MMKTRITSWGRWGLIAVLCALQACGRTNPGRYADNQSSVKALTLANPKMVSSYYFALDDLTLGQDFESYEPRSEWLKMVACTRSSEDARPIDGSEFIDEETLKTFTKLSQFRKAQNCRDLKVRTLQLIKPESLAPGTKDRLKLDLGNRSPGFWGSFSRRLQQAFMPIQTLSSVLWTVYIYQMVKSDPNLKLASITQTFKKFVVSPVFSSFRLLAHSIAFDPLAFEKFMIAATQSNEARLFTDFLERLSHPKQQGFYAKDMAREFKAFLAVNKDSKFIPKFLKGINVVEFEKMLLDKEKSNSIARLFLQYRNEHRTFDLSWFRTQNEWLVRQKKINPFKNIKARDLDGLDELIKALQKSGGAMSVSEEMKQAKKIYLGLRTGRYRIANRLLVIAVWVGIIKISWDLFQSLLRDDSKAIVSEALSRQFRLASLNVHQNIKDSLQCTDQMKRGIDIFDRKSIIKSVIDEECGNLIYELNNVVVPSLVLDDFGTEKNFIAALDSVRVISKTLPDLYELTFETQVLK